MTLISFDIDGTMIFGSPPGTIGLDTVRRAKELGYLIGSASDRPIGNQEELWRTHGITVDFVSLKHHLPQIKDRFPATRYLHIGDTWMDQHFAKLAGFQFLYVHEVPGDEPGSWVF
ncbi:MAG: HAD family hydrolase [Dehalococcoidia bacterium]|nr:HAD family hydrolase [Dehalococcoidia bacterium]